MKEDGTILAVCNGVNHFVVFILDGQRFALPLSAVERVVRAVEITTLPEAPETVLGVVSIQGRIIPVINVRKRFRLPEREVELSDKLVIVRTSRQTAAFIVDAVTDVVEHSEQQSIKAEEILPGLREYVESVMELEDDMIIVCSLARILSFEEAEILENTAEEKR